MEWSKNKPAQPGWYWFRHNTQDNQPAVIEVLLLGQCLCVNEDGDSVEDVCARWDYCEWCYIPEPTDPKEA